MEPYYFVEVQAPADCVSSVYTVLARRRLVQLILVSSMWFYSKFLAIFFASIFKVVFAGSSASIVRGSKLFISDALRDLDHLHSLKNVKNTHGGVLLLVKLQAKSL